MVSVEQIQPILKIEHLNDFKGIIDFSKQSEISDVIAFLCKLRHIFVKHYLTTEQWYDNVQIFVRVFWLKLNNWENMYIFLYDIKLLIFKIKAFINKN